MQRDSLVPGDDVVVYSGVPLDLSWYENAAGDRGTSPFAHGAYALAWQRPPARGTTPS